MQDAEERREKGVTMNSILNSLFTSFDWFFFSRVLKKQLFWHIKARENTEREQKREKENSKKNTQHRHARERKFLTRFWSKNASQNYTISHQNIREYFVCKFSLTTNDA